jgi:hypothetical protein
MEVVVVEPVVVQPAVQELRYWRAKLFYPSKIN